MKKNLVLCIALIGLLGLGSSAFAVKDTWDNVPAATLLLPYFEVDLANPNGVTTLFSINNASAIGQIAHVTVWSNQSIPVFDFDVYLSGYDVATFNMRDVVNLDLSQAIGEFYDFEGDWSIFNDALDYTYCYLIFPTYPTYGIDNPAFKAHVIAALTGKVSPVTGRYYGCGSDNIARGYVTVDLVDECSILTATSAGYFTNVTLDDNVLWGDYFYVNPAQNFAQGETLVHIESFPEGYVAGDITFYGRYISFQGFDWREPGPTTYATRFLNGGPFSGGTQLIVWREGGVPAPFASAGAACALQYATRDYAFFDEEENPWQKFCISGDPTCAFGTIEAVKINPAAIFATMPYDFGWMYWNLNWAGLTLPAQSFVTTTMEAEGRYAVGFDAIGLDNANAAIDIRINPFQ